MTRFRQLPNLGSSFSHCSRCEFTGNGRDPYLVGLEGCQFWAPMRGGNLGLGAQERPFGPHPSLWDFQNSFKTAIWLTSNISSLDNEKRNDVDKYGRFKKLPRSPFSISLVDCLGNTSTEEYP